MRDLLAKRLIITTTSLLLYLFVWAFLGLVIYLTAGYGMC